MRGDQSRRVAITSGLSMYIHCLSIDVPHSSFRYEGQDQETKGPLYVPDDSWMSDQEYEAFCGQTETDPGADLGQLQSTLSEYGLRRVNTGGVDVFVALSLAAADFGLSPKQVRESTMPDALLPPPPQLPHLLPPQPPPALQPLLPTLKGASALFNRPVWVYTSHAEEARIFKVDEDGRDPRHHPPVRLGHAGLHFFAVVEEGQDDPVLLPDEDAGAPADTTVGEVQLTDLKEDLAHCLIQLRGIIQGIPS